MNKKILVGLLVLMLIPAWLFAGVTGKISGVIKDKDTGEPLPGVNVTIEGTMMGAATDINGMYIILNVPVGTYVVKAQYIGYKTVDMTDVRVSADLTTEVSFDLPPTVLEGEMVRITAERPIINKNVTNTVKTIQADELKNLPARGVQTVMNLSSAVVDGSHVRGGRSEENVTYIDGVMTTLLRGGDTNALTVINNAIEESNFHAGGFNAEYGFATSGVLQTTTKSGGSDYHFSLEGISDEVFKNNENKTLGADSWGYNTYTVTAGGPIPYLFDKKLRFFVAGERNFDHGYATNYEGFEIDTVLTSQGKDFHFVGGLPAGPGPGYYSSSYDINGNLTYNLQSMRFKFGGTYHNGETKGGAGTTSFLNQEKNGITKYWNASSYLNITHQVNPKLFYTFNLNYFYYKNEYGDPDLWDDIAKYGDPEYNADLVDWNTSYTYSLYGLYTFQIPGQVTSGYGKTAQSNWGPKFDLVWQFNNFNELKAGFEYNYYTIRRYAIDPFAVSLNLHNRAITPEDTRTEYDLYRNSYGYYGYDMFGNEIDEDQMYEVTNDQSEIISVNGHDAPKHPVRAALYVQDKIELKDLVLNAGLRFDYFASGTESWIDPSRLILNDANLLGDESFGDEKVYKIISPRLGWSFPVTEKTVFHAQFGKFVQMPKVDDMYDGHTYVGRFLQGGNARSMPNPNLEPMQTIQYEVGIKQQIGQNASLNLTAFYKDEKDKIQLRVYFPEEGYGYSSYFQYQNVDYGTTKGLTLSLNLRRINRISGSVEYTYSKAMGTGSGSGTHFDIAWQDQSLRFPTIIMPLEFNQDHVANFNLDFRLNKDDGPTIFNFKPLANLGINIIYLMHSGNRYTRTEPGPRGLFSQNAPRPLEALNSSVMPWYQRMDLKIDRSFQIDQFRLKPYIWVYNVFNIKNVTGVYTQTGEAQDNGWFQTEDGKAWEEINGDAGMYWARYALTGGGNANLSTPRIMRFGLLVEF